MLRWCVLAIWLSALRRNILDAYVWVHFILCFSQIWQTVVTLSLHSPWRTHLMQTKYKRCAADTPNSHTSSELHIKLHSAATAIIRNYDYVKRMRVHVCTHILRRSCAHSGFRAPQAYVSSSHKIYEDWISHSNTHTQIRGKNAQMHKIRVPPSHTITIAFVLEFHHNQFSQRFFFVVVVVVSCSRICFSIRRLIRPTLHCVSN